MFARLFKKTLEQPLLGRWARTCERLNGIKATWANTDHCGTCAGELKPVKIVHVEHIAPIKMKTENQVIHKQDAPH
jgi:hypothetical protein